MKICDECHPKPKQPTIQALETSATREREVMAGQQCHSDNEKGTTMAEKQCRRNEKAKAMRQIAITALRQKLYGVAIKLSWQRDKASIAMRQKLYGTAVAQQKGKTADATAMPQK